MKTRAKTKTLSGKSFFPSPFNGRKLKPMKKIVNDAVGYSKSKAGKRK